MRKETIMYWKSEYDQVRKVAIFTCATEFTYALLNLLMQNVSFRTISRFSCTRKYLGKMVSG